MKTKVTQTGHQSGPIAGQNRKLGEVLDLPDEEAHSLHAAGLVAIQKPSRIDLHRAADLQASEAAKAIEESQETSAPPAGAAVVIAPDTVIEVEPLHTSAQTEADDKNKVNAKKKH